MTTSVTIADIVIDAGTQIRAAINEDVVTQYAERMAAGDVFPPVVLFHDGNAYYVGDGFHRTMAAQRNGLVDIPADVQPGTRQDALWFALGANKTNGQRLSDADRRRAVVLAVTTFMHQKSQHEIAKQIGCSQGFVSQVITRNNLGRPERVPGADGKTYPSSIEARHEAREKAEALFREGMSVDDVRKSTGIGRESAYEIKRGLGTNLSGATDDGREIRKHPKTDEIEAMLRDGRTVDQIRVDLRVSPVTVKKVRDEACLDYTDKSRAAVSMRRKDVRDMAERGFTTRQIASAVGIHEATVGSIAKAEGIVIHADRIAGKTARHDANRIVDQMVTDADNLTADVALIDFSSLDAARLAGWIDSLSKSRHALGTFIRRLTEEQKKHGEAA